jgi:hypothetical protein
MLAFADMTPSMTYFEKADEICARTQSSPCGSRNPPDPPESRLTKIYKNSLEYYRRLRQGRESLVSY